MIEIRMDDEARGIYQTGGCGNKGGNRRIEDTERVTARLGSAGSVGVLLSTLECPARGLVKAQE